MLMPAKSLDYEKFAVGPLTIGCLIMVSDHNKYGCHATLTLDWQYEIPNTGLGPFSLHSLGTFWYITQSELNSCEWRYFH